MRDFVTQSGIDRAMNSEDLKEHILKFQPEGEAPKIPHNAELHQDIANWFIDYFTRFPNKDQVMMATSTLILNMCEKYEIASLHYYDEVDIEKRLTAGYKKKGYSFIFLRSDFIKKSEK